MSSNSPSFGEILCMCRLAQIELWDSRSVISVQMWEHTGTPGGLCLSPKSAKLQAAAASESNNLFVTSLPVFSLALFFLSLQL